jgi:hypothetical protein
VVSCSDKLIWEIRIREDESEPGPALCFRRPWAKPVLGPLRLYKYLSIKYIYIILKNVEIYNI